MENLPTRQRLMLIYGKTHIPLEQATADWLPHISEKTARRRAKTQTLPWLVINTDNSQKTSQFVSLTAIADWLDQREQQAKTEWRKIHG